MWAFGSLDMALGRKGSTCCGRGLRAVNLLFCSSFPPGQAQFPWPTHPSIPSTTLCLAVTCPTLWPTPLPMAPFLLFLGWPTSYFSGTASQKILLTLFLPELGTSACFYVPQACPEPGHSCTPLPCCGEVITGLQ